LLEPGHPNISISRQCELLDIPRSSAYYKPSDKANGDEELKRILEEARCGVIKNSNDKRSVRLNSMPRSEI